MVSTRIVSITSQLQAGVEKLAASDAYRSYLRLMSRLSSYSVNNTILIWMQKPDATFVAGYKTWQTEYHRLVKRGEKGIRIYAPVHRIRQTGEEDPDEEEEDILYYRAIYVFDISQTTGQEIPLLAHPWLKDNVRGYQKMLKALLQTAPVPIHFGPIAGRANGYYDPVRRQILIREDLPQLQAIKTILHETAHAILHDPYPFRQDKEKDRRSQEVEAESTAYIVLSYFGLDTSAYSFPYIAGWCSSAALPELRASLSRISTASSYLVRRLEKALTAAKKTAAVSSPAAGPERPPQTSERIPAARLLAGSGAETGTRIPLKIPTPD